ncbi:MAG: ABC transporter substrate-binding protein [Ilumatobacter sp.]|uniref:ABC transporter substrate-binding protein n=1 Tax=Ilumatobacter sp. TaxID=1967498 RepID=UPI0032996A75
MTSRSRNKRLAAAAFSFALVAAACGGSSDGGGDDAAGDDPVATEAAGGDTETTEAADDGGDTETTEAADDGGDTETTEADDGGETETTEAGGGDEGPVEEPTGEPFVIGVQNLEGDPNGSFPEFSVAIQAAADYVNAELGGLQGRPIEIELCKSVVSPDDSQRCANELSADGVDLAISTINFFGNHFSIYQGSDIPVLVVTPVTIADFTSEGVYSIGAGGGCLGAHTGLIEFVTNQIEAEEGITVNKVGVPWADTPPGVVCYNDLEAKPLDVLNGTEPGDAERAGSKPDLTYVGVPVAPALPDATPQATEVLDFEPDAIIFSGQGADCWNLVDAMGRLGWTPEQIPLVLSGSCTDFDAMRAAGPLAEGVYFIGSGNSLLSPLDGQEPGKNLDEATIYQTKMAEYGVSEDDIFKGFGTQGFSAIMNIWEIANGVDGDVTAEAIEAGFQATDGTADTFGGLPLNCSGAPDPYVAVCSSSVSVNRWTGDAFETVEEELTGLDLVAGTELRPGPT